MISSEKFLQNLEVLKTRMQQACMDCDRSVEEVRLLPVTKNWPVEAVRYCLREGIRSVGENRVQEARQKQDLIEGIEWELIGHLQSNKVNQVVGRFARVQTVDSVKLMRKLQGSLQREGLSLRILLQVNSGNDPAKHGFMMEDASMALDEALSCDCLVVEGLMTIAPHDPGDARVARECFLNLAQLSRELSAKKGVELPELSMGMSDDLADAIACGSTMIRVGSALFGDRAEGNAK